MEVEETNPYPFIISGFLILSGSLLAYFENYKNIGWVTTLSVLLIIAGWIGWVPNKEDLPEREEKTGWFKKRGNIASMYGLSAMMILLNLIIVFTLAGNRTDRILNNKPTQMIIAKVAGIDERVTRNTVSYYAIFEYSLNGKVIQHYQEEHSGDFIVNQKYVIKCSVDHPEMFTIVRKVR